MFTSKQRVHGLLRMVLLGNLLFFLSCENKFEPVKPGLDVLIQESINLIEGRKIGIITNHTALSSNGEHIVDVLIKKVPNIHITALFAPEHGIRGDRTGGEFIETYIDSLTGITVFSLYQRNRKPTSEMLDSLDLLLFDIMDIGTRFYTYMSTMALAMEAAAEHGIPFIVLDRPNPISGEIIEGPILQPEHKSFVGMFPIPIRHGLTAGELALMINGEGWLANGIHADLTVVPMKNWQRMQWFDQTGLPWIKTSPNMPTLDAAILYPGMGLLEGVNISEGRGTSTPFNLIGAPWIEPDIVKSKLSAFQTYGIQLESREFTPVSIANAAPSPEYEDQLCKGFYLHIENRNVFRSVSFSLNLLSTLYQLYKNELTFNSYFDRLLGDSNIKQQIMDGIPVRNIIASWSGDLAKYKMARKNYLLY